MEHKKSWIKLTVASIASALLLSNCVTSYDQYGRPIQTVDPGAAAVGALVIGAAAYAIGENNRSHRPSRGYYNSGHGRRSSGYYGGGGYSGCRY